MWRAGRRDVEEARDGIDRRTEVADLEVEMRGGRLAGRPDIADAAANHSNRVIFDEPAMASGVAMYAAFALDALRPD